MILNAWHHRHHDVYNHPPPPNNQIHHHHRHLHHNQQYVSTLDDWSFIAYAKSPATNGCHSVAPRHSAAKRPQSAKANSSGATPQPWDNWDRRGVDQLMQSWVWAITVSSMQTLYHHTIGVPPHVILISGQELPSPTNQPCFQAMNIFSPSLRAFSFALSGLHMPGQENLKYKRTQGQALTCWESFDYTPPALEKLKQMDDFWCKRLPFAKLCIWHFSRLSKADEGDPPKNGPPVSLQNSNLKHSQNTYPEQKLRNKRHQ